MQVRSCLPAASWVSSAWTTSGEPRNLWKLRRTRMPAPAQDQDAGAVGGCQAAEGADRGQGVGGPLDRGGAAVEDQAAVDVPGGAGPVPGAAEPADLQQGVVVLVRLDPHAREAGADVLDQPLGERHGLAPFLKGSGMRDRGRGPDEGVRRAEDQSKSVKPRPWPPSGGAGRPASTWEVASPTSMPCTTKVPASATVRSYSKQSS
jgi:hypothetical protein